MKVKGYVIEPGANLSGTNLSDANLRYANLSGANLRHANLRHANLSDANLSDAYLPHFQIPDGVLIGWKKVEGHLIKLEIPLHAERTGTPMGRKCRCNVAKVLSITERFTGRELDGTASTRGLVYKAGETVVPDEYDPDIRVECTHGIHFFLTKQEAKEW